MGMNVAQKLITAHLAQGEMTPGTEIVLGIDQTLTQDATGTITDPRFAEPEDPFINTQMLLLPRPKDRR